MNPNTEYDKVKEYEKKNKFYGFFQTVIINYWQTILFIFLIVILLVTLKYAQDRLDFPESKMVLNWFGLIVIGNLLITYFILIIYQQVKNQPGFVGSSGYQGPIGNQGYSDYCEVCKEKLDIMEHEYEVVAPPQPLMPEKIIVERTKTKPKSISKYAA